MRTIVVHCDLCEMRIDGGRTRLVMACGPTSHAWPMDPESGRPTLDVCPACIDALGSWLRLRTAAKGGG